MMLNVQKKIINVQEQYYRFASLEIGRPVKSATKEKYVMRVRSLA